MIFVEPTCGKAIHSCYYFAKVYVSMIFSSPLAVKRYIAVTILLKCMCMRV